MENYRLRGFIGSVLLIAALLSALVSAGAPVGPPTLAPVDPYILEEMAAAPDGRAGFFVRFHVQADLAPAYQIDDWERRGQFVYETLRATADASQARLQAWLCWRGLEYQSFFIDDSLFVTADRATLEILRAFPEVAALQGNHTFTLGPIPAPSLPAGEPDGMALSSPRGIAWGIQHVGADQVWDEFAITGQGIVVANIDSGVVYSHSALLPNYRCGAGPHDDCWYDPAGTCPDPLTPCDNVGTGTHVTGVMVGDENPSLFWNAGMAPDAQWIACKGCRTTACYLQDLTACGEWLLAPNGDPANRPHVVQASWMLGGCNDDYAPHMAAFRAAGIFPAFGIGNVGPDCGTATSPGDYPGVLSSGGTGPDDVIAPWSSRGPSCWGPVKPDVTAPGVDICSAWPVNSWLCTVDGSGPAAAHAAGLVALLWQANPALVGNYTETVQAITSTAVPLTSTQGCGGIPGGQVPNNVYGWGRIDAYAAVAAQVQPCQAVTLTGFAWLPPTPTAGQAITFSASASGTRPISYGWDFGDDTTGAGGTVTHAYAQAGTYTVVLTASNCGGAGLATATRSLTVEVASVCTPVEIVSVTTNISDCRVGFAAALGGDPPFLYDWDWGPWGSSGELTPTVDFGADGTYPFTLTAWNCLSLPTAYSDTYAGEVTVACGICDPVHGVDFSWTPLTPTAGQAVHLAGSAAGTPPLTFSWDLGDGALGSGPAVMHTYVAADPYTVVLTVGNCTTATAAATHTLVVTACDPVHGVDFSWTPPTPTAGQAVYLAGSAAGTPPLAFSWDLGDGTAASGPAVTHTYAFPGLYTVVLTVGNACGEGVFQHNLVVRAPAPEFRIYLPLVFK